MTSHTWALATYFATDDISCENTNDGQVEDREQQKMEEQQQQHEPNPDDSILSVKERSHKGRKLAKQEVMPTWVATKSLLSCNSQSHSQTNSEVVAPLFKTSPTDYATLYTVLMLTQGISAFVVGPE